MYRIYCAPNKVKEVSMRLGLKKINWYIERIVFIDHKPYIMMIALPDDEGELNILEELGFTEYSV